MYFCELGSICLISCRRLFRKKRKHQETVATEAASSQTLLLGKKLLEYQLEADRAPALDNLKELIGHSMRACNDESLSWPSCASEVADLAKTFQQFVSWFSPAWQYSQGRSSEGYIWKTYAKQFLEVSLRKTPGLATEFNPGPQ